LQLLNAVFPMHEELQQLTMSLYVDGLLQTRCTHMHTRYT